MNKRISESIHILKKKSHDREIFSDSQTEEAMKRTILFMEDYNGRNSLFVPNFLPLRKPKLNMEDRRSMKINFIQSKMIKFADFISIDDNYDHFWLT